MDIDLLSKMVKELILDNERVVLPGLGSFVAEIVPASFSDKGYTINPPYRKLYFRSKPDEGSDLIPFYAKSNSVSEEIAEKIITDFVTDLKSILFHKKTIIFPGLGRLRATKENNVFFVADEDLDIYPEGFGLEPISLKTHQATTAEVKAAVSDLKTILSEPVESEPIISEEPAEKSSEFISEEVVEPVSIEIKEESSSGRTDIASETAPVEEQTSVQVMPEETSEVENLPEIIVEEVKEEVVEVPEEGGKAVLASNAEQVTSPKKSVWKKLLLALMWLVITFVVLVAAYVIVAHMCPEWIDQFLYTQEELELLNNIY